MTFLLERAEFFEEHGIRPRSLKVTTISALMGEIVKGTANLAQLSVHGNYRAITAQDMGKVYSRNTSQKQLSASKYSQKAVKENQAAEGLSANVPDFNEISQGDSAASVSDVRGGKPMDWAIAILKKREQAHVLQMGGKLLRGSFAECLKEPDGQIGPDLTISQEVILPEKKEKRTKK